MNFVTILKVLNVVDKIRAEIANSGIDLGKWVDLALKVFPIIVKILENLQNNLPIANLGAEFAAVKTVVEASGLDYTKWIALLVKLIPLIQELIALFKK